MAEKHTKGPWIISEMTTEIQGHGEIRSQDNNLAIADTWWGLSERFPRFEAGEANARLIAAAPELLEVTAALADRLSVYGADGKPLPLDPIQQRAWILKLKTALTQATGEAGGSE